LAITYKEQIKSWLKVHSLAFAQKYCTVPVEGMDTSTGSGNLAEGILPKLGEIIMDLRNVSEVA
jgi:hypothetical protein